MRCYSYTETDWSDIILLPATFCLYSVVWEAWLRWSNDKYIQKFIWNQMHLILNHSTKELLKPLFTGTQMSFPTLNSLEYSVGDLLGFRNFWHWIHIDWGCRKAWFTLLVFCLSLSWFFFSCHFKQNDQILALFFFLHVLYAGNLQTPAFFITWLIDYLFSVRTFATLMLHSSVLFFVCFLLCVHETHHGTRTLLFTLLLIICNALWEKPIL